MNTISITNKNFHREVLSVDEPVLVDFWAPWCGPCKMFSPVLEKIAEENRATVKVAKINIEEEPELARKYNIMSIPTLLLFKRGEVVSSSTGLKLQHQVEAMFK